MTKQKTFTYKHDSFRNVVWLHQRISVQPQLLWLNHSLKWFQELCESVKEQKCIQKCMSRIIFGWNLTFRSGVTRSLYPNVCIEVAATWVNAGKKNSAPMNKLVVSCCSSISILGLCWGLPGHPGICRTWSWFLSSQQNLFWHLFHTP